MIPHIKYRVEKTSIGKYAVVEDRLRKSSRIVKVFETKEQAKQYVRQLQRRK